MQCFSPISVKNKNTGSYNLVPCGRCGACKSNRRLDWSNRILEEYKVSKNAYFVTLTYNTENLPINEYGLVTLNKKDCQDFMKRLRKRSIFPLRFFLAGEYGGKFGRPHYHMIIFNLSHSKVHAYKYLLEAWNKGNVHIGQVNEQTVQYTTKYSLKPVEYDFRQQKPFALMSRKPGIGANYIDRMSEWHNQDFKRMYIPLKGGQKNKLPRYYKDRIYSYEAKYYWAEHCYLRSEEDPLNRYENWITDQQKKGNKVTFADWKKHCELKEERHFLHNKKILENHLKDKF